MKQETFYCLVLSESQARFLATSKYGIDRMKALVSLIEMAATTEKDFNIKGFSAIVHVGQVVISEVELSHLWNCTRKTVAKVLERMSQMGLLSTIKTNRTSIHTLLCVSAWQVDGAQVRNPFYVPMKKRGADDTTRMEAAGETDAPSSIAEGATKAHNPSDANVHTQEEVTRKWNYKNGLELLDVLSRPLNRQPSSDGLRSFYGAVNQGQGVGDALEEHQEGYGSQEEPEDCPIEVAPEGVPTEAEFEAMLNDTAARMMAEEEDVRNHPGSILPSPDGGGQAPTSYTPR
jgi:CRP-like cAMP-binding protein